MKKLTGLILATFLLLSLCGCGNQNTESKAFSQEVTIVTLPSPPKCKTTDDISAVNEIIAILGEIEKSPIDSENVDGWNIMIKLKIDGETFTYTIGGVFTDSNGKQYNVTNLEETQEKIMKIYSKIDATEVDYP